MCSGGRKAVLVRRFRRTRLWETDDTGDHRYYYTSTFHSVPSRTYRLKTSSQRSCHSAAKSIGLNMATPHTVRKTSSTISRPLPPAECAGTDFYHLQFEASTLMIAFFNEVVRRRATFRTLIGHQGASNFAFKNAFALRRSSGSTLGDCATTVKSARAWAKRTFLADSCPRRKCPTAWPILPYPRR